MRALARCLWTTTAVGMMLAPRLARTQAPAADSAAVAQVFLDCQRAFCDGQFIRTEIAWVNFVRDRMLADVHVIVTQQQTGGAGSEYTLSFIGLGARANLQDTAVFATQLGDTDDEIRRQLVRHLSQGLLRYVRGTEAARQLSVVYRPAATVPRTASRGTKDRWNYWVYRIGMNANLNANSNFKAQNYSSRLSANRVTDAWKLQFNARGEYSNQTYQLSDGELSRIQREYGGNADVIKSINAHWSVGVNTSAQQDLFNNYDLDASFKPGIEYNFFPYSEATRRQVLVRYSPGFRMANYVDTTIYGRVSETRPHHSLVVSGDAVQPWGSVGISLNASQYLHETNRRRFGVFGNADWRIVRGLNFNVGGGYSYIRDQLQIPGTGLTDEERLVQLRVQATNYEYFMFTGLSFTFGSAFNNVVNTRFGGGGRSFFFSF
ncbi:MAG: DUF481 domain-containing protein [Gemmatimonadetes bacterium]|nr:DUF481 domain-containing protein [Gemmatimonadota bacterium]